MGLFGSGSPLAGYAAGEHRVRSISHNRFIFFLTKGAPTLCRAGRGLSLHGERRNSSKTSVNLKYAQKSYGAFDEMVYGCLDSLSLYFYGRKAKQRTEDYRERVSGRMLSALTE